MLVTADWVLPVSRPPIRDGGVIVKRGRIAEVGRADELRGLNPDAEVHHFPGCIVTPGLVNAHTHLSLTALEGLFEPSPFEQWLPRLVTALSAWERDDFAASASLGAARCLKAGVTVVGDIVYGPEAVSVAADMGLGGTFCWEVLGVSAPRVFAELEKAEYPLEKGGVCGQRIACGLSPHAVYTSGPRTIQLMHETAQQLLVPFVIHLAESSAEVELCEQGTGPLAEVAERRADGFAAPHMSPVAYLDQLGALKNATVVHAGYAEPSDVARLAAAARGVVACPRSNAFLSNPVAPVLRLMRAGVPVGIGTDSSASNTDLDLIEEVRALHAEHPSIPPARLLEFVTSQGAIALGLEERFGMLEPGLHADLAIFEVGETYDPETTFVRHAGAATLRALLTEGVWRVRDGELVDTSMVHESAARAARIRAEHALQRA